MAQNAETKNVYKRISIVGFVEIDFTAYRRYANAIPVVGDSGNHTRKQTSIVSGLQRIPMDRTESQRIQEQDGPRAHSEDIANDSAHTRCSTLEWLDRARMIVAFHFKGNSPVVANIDYAC